MVHTTYSVLCIPISTWPSHRNRSEHRSEPTTPTCCSVTSSGTSACSVALQVHGITKTRKHSNKNIQKLENCEVQKGFYMVQKGLKIAWELLYGSRLVLSFCPNMMEITAICHFNRTVASMISGILGILRSNINWSFGNIHNKQKILYVVYGTIPNDQLIHTSVGHSLCHLGPTLKILSTVSVLVFSSNIMTIEPPK